MWTRICSCTYASFNSTKLNAPFTNRASPTQTPTRQTFKAMWPKQLAKRRPGQISSRWTGTKVLQVMQLSGIISTSISPSVIYDTSDLCFERADYDLIYTNPCKSYTSCQSTTQTLPVHLVKAPLALHQALCLFCPPPCPQQGGCHKAHIQPHRKVEFHLTVFPSSQQSFNHLPNKRTCASCTMAKLSIGQNRSPPDLQQAGDQRTAGKDKITVS